jgi:magnesium chelatase subunit D
VSDGEPNGVRTPPRPRPWADVIVAARMLAVDPFGLGGIHLRARSGPARDRVCAWIRGLVPATTPCTRIPVHVTDDRLLGGIALAATLKRGTVVWEQGLLASSHGGLVVLPMAERMESRISAQLCAVLDRGQLALERDGMTGVAPCAVSCIVLDEGIDDEQVEPSLLDRLAFGFDLEAFDPRAMPEEIEAVGSLAEVRARLEAVELAPEAIDALCRAALALGIDSLRAVLLAGRAARVHAALAGRAVVETADLDVAARLVLGRRATRIDAPSEAEPPNDAPPEREEDREPEGEQSVAPPEPPPPRDDDDVRTDDSPSPAALENIVLEAAKSGVPEGLLELLKLSGPRRTPVASTGQKGTSRLSTQGGRPAGSRASPLRQGARLAVLDTLRAAAPWQRLRGRNNPAECTAPHRVEVRREDFRVKQFRQRTETCVIFAVDASGSAALQRLAEAKGAVEHLLADCYVRRDHVALIAFRGTQADVVLPPTRSLARVRRRLADLAGGGTTPLAAGIDAATALAADSRKRGRTPLVVMMTDGRGNVALDGRTGEAATDDALACSRRLRLAGVPALMLDTSPRATPRVRKLASEMNARYLALPYVDSAGVSREIRSLALESAPCR